MKKIRLAPVGFWSYARQDDELSQGKLSTLRSLLMFELQQQYGRDQIHIFQDATTIPHGAAWEQEIKGALDKTTFFIPIVTPNFIQSDWCCREVSFFLGREAELCELYPDLPKRSRIFPIQFIDIDEVDPADPNVLTALESLQWFDFRRFRHRSYESEGVREAISELAVSMRELLQIKVEDPAEAIERAREAEEAEARARREEEAKAARAREEEARRRREAAQVKAEASRKRAEEAAEAARKRADEAAEAARAQAAEADEAARLLAEEEAAAESARIEAEIATQRLTSGSLASARQAQMESEAAVARARQDSEAAERARVEKEAAAEKARAESDALAARERLLAEKASLGPFPEPAPNRPTHGFAPARFRPSPTLVAIVGTLLIATVAVLAWRPARAPARPGDTTANAAEAAPPVAAAPAAGRSWLYGRWCVVDPRSRLVTSIAWTVSEEGDRIITLYPGEGRLERQVETIRGGRDGSVRTNLATYARGSDGNSVTVNSRAGSVTRLERCHESR